MLEWVDETKSRDRVTLRSWKETNDMTHVAKYSKRALPKAPHPPLSHPGATADSDPAKLPCGARRRGKQTVLADLLQECAILTSFLGARGPIIEL
jgi:hypothetical protein